MVLLFYHNATQKTMRQRNPKQLLPLIYAIESAEDAVKHLTVVYERLMEDIENGDDPTIVEVDEGHLKAAKNWQQTAAKYLKEFEGGSGE